MPDVPRGVDTVWGCPQCYTTFDTDECVYCDYCEEQVCPIERDADTMRPLDTFEEGSPTDCFQCGACGAAKLVPGGTSLAAPQMHGWCPNCCRETVTIFADLRSAFCCTVCRRLRDVPERVLDGGDGVARRVFQDWCDYCEDMTDTGKVDFGNESEDCCDECRAEWTGTSPDGGCAACGDSDGEMVEIDD
ncbi:hypothetical protein Q5752_000926 [Cryptotrichosporon argae]